MVDTHENWCGGWSLKSIKSKWNLMVDITLVFAFDLSFGKTMKILMYTNK